MTQRGGTKRNSSIFHIAFLWGIGYNNCKTVIINELMRVRTFPPAGRKTHMRNDTINADALRLRLWYHNCKTVMIHKLMRRRAFPRFAWKRRCAMIP